MEFIFIHTLMSETENWKQSPPPPKGIFPEQNPSTALQGTVAMMYTLYFFWFSESNSFPFISSGCFSIWLSVQAGRARAMQNPALDFPFSNLHTVQQTDSRNCLKAVCFATAHTALQCNSKRPVLPKCSLLMLGLWHEELRAWPDADTHPSTSLSNHGWF